MSETEATENSFIIIWKVENYSKTLYKGWRTSPNISSNYGNVQWKLRVERIGFENIFRVSQVNCNNNFTLDGCVLSLLASDGSVLVKEETRNVDLSNSGEKLTLKCDQLFNERRWEFLPEDVLTVRCRFWNSNGQGTSDTVYLSSHLGEFNSSFIWAVEEFSSLLKSQKRNLVVTGGNALRSLHIDAFCDNCETFSVTMMPYLDDSQSIQSTLRVAILDCKGEVIESEKDERVIFTGVSSHQKLEFVALRPTLMNNKDLYLPGDVLFLQCDMIIKGIPIHDYFSYNESNDLVKSKGNSFRMQSICQVKDSEGIGRGFQFKKETSLMTTPYRSIDFKAMLEEKILFDFNLRIDSESFPVHKAVLSARSRVFRSMFERDTNEAREHSMEVEDVDVNTMRRFLLFLYTDELQEDLECQDLVNLYYVADTYQVLHLRDKCSFLLKGVLSVDNIFNILILVDKLPTDEDLNVTVKEYVERNDEEIVSSVKWKKFETENLGLALKILREMFFKSKK